MHIRYALRDDTTKSQDTYTYPASVTSLSVANSSQGGNGLLNFGMALGGILIVTIVTGIIAYIYRRKINCNNKSQETSKGSGRISCIMECYSNDYVINPNNSYITKQYVDESDNPTKVKSDERNTMKSIFSSIYNKSIKRPNTVMNFRSTSKSNKSTMISVNDEKKSRPHTVEYSIPQISSPIPMPSASIYDTERATSLAANLSRSTTLNVSSHPLPPLPLPTIDKEPKETVRNSRNSGDSRDSKTNSITNFNSLYNLIPLMFQDSDATTVETVLNDNRSYNNNNNSNNSNNNSSNDDTIDLIRFSINSGDNGQSSRHRPNQQLQNSIINESIESYETESHETESQSHEDITKEYFIKELERNIERNPEKYKFLKNPVQNPDNWKRNGNSFEYRLQRSRTVI